MKRKTLAVVITVTMLAVTGGVTTAASAAATPSRTTISDAPAWIHQATKTAAMPSSATVQLTITLRSPQAAAAQAFAQSVNEPGSTDYHHFLTPAQYASRFGPSAATANSVKSWLTSEGLKVTGEGIGYLTASGPAANAESAFGTQLATFKHDGQSVMAPTGAVTVPASLGSSVQSVLGLDTSPTFHDDIASQAQIGATVAKQLGVTLPAGAGTAVGGGTADDGGCASSWGQNQTPWVAAVAAPFNKALPDANCGYTPKQLDTARGITSTGLTGKGVTVGIILWCDDPNLVSDVNRWASNVHAQQLKPGQVTIDQPSAPYESYCATNEGADQIETSLDTEAIHAVAPDANIVYSPAVGPDDAGLVDALHRIIDTDAVNIINNSYSEPEYLLTPQAEAAYEAVLTQAAAEGITVLAASGDSSDNFFVATPYAEYPASDPWITSVGGTSLGLTSSDKVDFEQAWFTAISVDEGGWTAGLGATTTWAYEYGGGGGVSALFSQPAYQQGVVPAKLAGTTPMRVYPDIANVADPSTGFLMGWTDPYLGWNNYYMEDIGGTSLASPFTAGQVALADQANGAPLGFLNPVIYKDGSRYLTGLTSNAVTHGNEAIQYFFEFFGVGPVSEATAMNAQSLFPSTTLSLAPGYNNLSGMGVPSNERKFISLLTSK
jgi:subtilase family serine protease